MLTLFVYNEPEMGVKDLLTERFLANADKFSDKQVVETLAMLVEHGVKHGASDIHIEPFERFVLVRYRIDGSLRGVHKLPRAALGTVLAAAKKRAGLNEQDTQSPQEGEYAETIDGHEVSIRLSTMPVFGGEKAVLHLSFKLGKPQELESLGFWGQGLTALQTVLTTPHGLVAVAGPRHSGVSSTLFSLLDQLNSPLVSIATVELHTKHRLPGASQSYIESNGMTVTEGLRAALKQDPNIIMLGDIPDSTTAELAVHAATTGHLLLAGLHAESAVAAALRLRVAGVEPFLLATGLRLCVGQRLVRALCPDCRERYALDADEQKQLAIQFGMLTPSARKKVHELERQLAPAIFGDVKQLNSTTGGVTHLWRPSSEGCAACGHTGYKGRVAIVEVLQNSDGIQKSLLSHEVLSVPTLNAVALKDGFVPLALDGLVKALRGQTTTAEVLRAVNTPS